MKKLAFTFLLITTVAFSQVERTLGDFTKVTSFDKLDVLLIKSTENRITINGNEAEIVETVNKNGELKIRMPFSQTMGGEDISVTLYYKNIEAVEANEGSRISSSENFKTTIFDIIAKEGAEVKINLDVDKLNVKGTSGAIISISGKAKNQDLLINSGSIFNAKSLETEQTTITVNAGGEADIYATNLVDAKVRAGGNITIYGKPRQINQKVVAGGTIREAK
ncbi:head GIN domain-containing protein [uncultured Flavobacterium sp.]|uniref:head GIN domain-containing protein n=1 Tax=uncultured Flavobacterium sp. TaxID=165435 RepID=UPI0030ECDDB3|tara:strand:+ start:1135 stop:1800 length:666 start_codon:yes stop_codon:yes gene_type:complete